MSERPPSPPADARQFAPAAARNREPILVALRPLLPTRGQLLEIASGSGQHTAHFAPAFPGLRFLPTDADASLLPSIDAWAANSGVANVARARLLDVRSDRWPVARVDVVYCANMVHIAPWECCLGLLRGAARHLAPGGLLITYGPYRIGGIHTAPSNAAFDRSLRARDPDWGVRDLEAVQEAASEEGLRLRERHAMPAHNQLLVFEGSPPA